MQTLSRFGLAYLLASSGTLKDTWVSVCAPAGEKGPAPDVEDLELRGAAHRDKRMLGRVLGQAKQDSALGDAIAVVSRGMAIALSYSILGWPAEFWSIQSPCPSWHS